MAKLWPVKSLIGLYGLALLAFVTAQFLLVGESVANGGRAISIGEIRQTLENAKAHYHGSDPEGFGKAIDSSLAALRARYGEQIPAVDAIRFLREFPFPTGDTSPALHESGSSAHNQVAARGDATRVDERKPPEGVTIERTPAGFLLRASSRSLVGGILGIGFALLLGAIPFIVFGDLIRSVWDAEGLSFWLGSAFLVAWAGGTIYALVLGCLGAFGETRITKTGNNGDIFTGIGKAGWSHRIDWSDFYGAGDRAVATASNRRFGHTTHYVGLNGTSKSYKFGSDLNEDQRAFIIAFLRETVFGSAATPPQPIEPEMHPVGSSGPSPRDFSPSDFAPKGVLAGNTIGLDRIRQAIEKAELEYHGRDPQGFKQAAGEFLASLKAQYGDQVPAADAVKRLEKFARASGAPIAISF